MGSVVEANNLTMAFQMTKRFGVRFHALIDEVGCEQLEVAEA
jgi:hypothetical protein